MTLSAKRYLFNERSFFPNSNFNLQKRCFRRIFLKNSPFFSNFKAMRVFIAFLLLASFYFPSACAKGNRPIVSIQKSLKKVAPIFDKARVLTKKNWNSLNKEPFAENLERIHQNVNNQNAAQALGLTQSTFNCLFTPILTISSFKSTGNYSYQFIFNCLFPKHTFW